MNVEEDKNLFYAIMEPGVKDKGDGIAFIQIIENLRSKELLSEYEYKEIIEYKNAFCEIKNGVGKRFEVFEPLEKYNSFKDSLLNKKLNNIITIANDMYQNNFKDISVSSFILNAKTDNEVIQLNGINGTVFSENFKSVLKPEFNSRYYEYIELKEARQASIEALDRADKSIQLSRKAIHISWLVMGISILIGIATIISDWFINKTQIENQPTVIIQEESIDKITNSIEDFNEKQNKELVETLKDQVE